MSFYTIISIIVSKTFYAYIKNERIIIMHKFATLKMLSIIMSITLSTLRLCVWYLWMHVYMLILIPSPHPRVCTLSLSVDLFDIFCTSHPQHTDVARLIFHYIAPIVNASLLSHSAHFFS